MNFNKNLTLALVIFAIIFSGCGKKKNSSCKLTDKPSSNSNKKVAQTDIPSTLKEEIVDLTDNDDENISEFAFIDDENDNSKTNKKGGVVVASNENGKLVKSGTLKESNSFVSWDEEENGTKSSLKTVYFDLNKNSIRKDQVNNIKTDIQEAKKLSEGKQIVVQGHCCQLGSPSYNLALSERRAQAIKDEMVRNGISEDKVKTIGYGQEMPVVQPTKKSKKAQIQELAPNRRAEIKIS